MMWVAAVYGVGPQKVGGLSSVNWREMCQDHITKLWWSHVKLVDVLVAVLSFS